jgi:hypothetical protein
LSLVEEAYFNFWGKVGGVGRLRRSFSLFVSTQRMFELQNNTRDRAPTLGLQDVLAQIERE